MITCPICGQTFSRIISTHAKTHGLSMIEFHKLRIETEYGCRLDEFLNDVYVAQRLSSTTIFKRYKLTYRMLRSLLELCNIPMRNRSEAVEASWSHDDGSRSEATSEKLKETMERFDFSGENNPTRRLEVRNKISEAKKKSNPGLMPMLIANSEARLANPSKSERIMMQALSKAGIRFSQEFNVGRYFIDFAIPAAKVAIEVDGSGWHERKPGHDARRDRWLTRRGWRVFRYSSRSVRENAQACVQDLITRLNALGIDPTAAQ